MSKLEVYNMFKKSKQLKDNQGILVSVEGLDGSGKGTQVNLLKEYLEKQGYKVAKYSFPQYESLIGKVISSYLKGEYGDVQSVPYELICIAYGADRAQASNEIKNLLNAGYIVLADRFTYSNIFTAAKMPEEKWLPFISWIEEMEFNQLRVAKPHYNFYLHVDPEISIQRIAERGKRDYQEGKEDIHENNEKLLRDTSRAYLRLASSNTNKWSIIDEMNTNSTQKSIEEVFELLKKEFLKLI